MTHRMYTDLATWWPLLSPPGDYEEESGVYLAAIREFASQPSATLLELGSGGGHNAHYLKRSFATTLVDLSHTMLDQSRRLNPELPHHQGDMRSVRLGSEFDIVFIHDAISYMTTRADLRRAVETAFVHCRPGGLALFAPDETKERFTPSTECGGSDDGTRGLRYLEWVWDPDPEDETCVADYAFMIRNSTGDVEVVQERHMHGLFPRQVWLDSLSAVGFEAHAKVYQHSALPEGHELFIGIRR